MNLLEIIFLLILFVGCSSAIILIVRSVLIEGAKEDVNYPLASCDTSMLDELESEEKKNE